MTTNRITSLRELSQKENLRVQRYQGPAGYERQAVLGRPWGRECKGKDIKMAAMHPAAIWLIIAAVVGIVLLIATLVANRNQKKKKKGKFVDVCFKYFGG